MANFYKINSQCTAFIAHKLSNLGYRNICHISRNNEIDDNTERLFIIMKNGDRKELKIVDV